MATVEVTKDNIEALVKKPGIVLIDWWASWCGPCRMFAPIFEGAAAKHPTLTFGKIDTDAQPELSSAFRIKSIPTLMIFRDGLLLFAQAGAIPADALEDLIAQAEKLDMAEVRREIEKTKGEPGEESRA